MNYKNPSNKPTLFGANDGENLSKEEKTQQENILREYVQQMMRPVISKIDKRKNKE